MTLEKCFANCCTCSCTDVDTEFNTVIMSESLIGLSLYEICHSNIGWFTDKSLAGHYLGEWDMQNKHGLYMIWHKNDYCPIHDLFHMKVLYVGKGNILQRLIKHWAAKDFSEEELLYFTYVEMPNRKAKYIEQLLLDIYNFPLNKSENNGTKTLCMYFTQTEVD